MVILSLGGTWPGPPRTWRGTIMKEAADATAPRSTLRRDTSPARFESVSSVMIVLLASDKHISLFQLRVIKAASVVLLRFTIERSGPVPGCGGEWFIRSAVESRG